MTGRPPKPTERQIAAGDPRKIGVHKLQQKLESEPQATHGLPDCPKHLTGYAREAWKFWSEQLAVMNLDRRPDAMMLEGACVMYSRARQAQAILDRDGINVEESVIDKDSGERIVLKIKSHPAVGISDRAWMQMKAFCSEFGLSPVSRTRLAVEKKTSAESDLMEALSRPRQPVN